MADKRITCSIFYCAYVISLLLGFALTNIPPKEHKVHNIVLYPDKHSWCKVTSIKQVISHTGCQSKSVDNNVCVGTCFSFSVPKTIPETPGDDQLHYCDSCQSSDSTWITVSLDCPEDSTLNKIEKSVEIIGNCSCMYCKEKPRNVQRPAEEDPEDYEEDLENLKQLQMYDIQQLALRNAALRGHLPANIPVSQEPQEQHSHHHTSNKHLDRLQEDDDEESETEVDDAVFQHVIQQLTTATTERSQETETETSSTSTETSTVVTEVSASVMDTSSQSTETSAERTEPSENS